MQHFWQVRSTIIMWTSTVWLLGHLSEAMTRKTEKEMKVIVSWQFKPCKACGLEKARNKNVSKTPVECSGIVGERLFIGNSLSTTTSLGRKHYWLLVVNDKSDDMWSFFLKEKSDLATTMMNFVKELKSKHGMNAKLIFCDNNSETRHSKM